MGLGGSFYLTQLGVVGFLWILDEILALESFCFE